MPDERAARRPAFVALAYVYVPGLWAPAPGTLVLRRGDDGRYRADAFPDEITVSEDVLRRAWLPGVRLDRGKLHVSAANGDAVYVPVGASPLDGCVRYGRLYLRPAA